MRWPMSPPTVSSARSVGCTNAAWRRPSARCRSSVPATRAGHDSLHPLDAALNLPPERYSLEVRRRVAVAAASRSFDEALFELSGAGARRWRRDAARPGRRGRRRPRRGRHGDPRHHPRGRVRLEGGACVPPCGESRIGVLGVDARAAHYRGQGPHGGGVDARCGDRRRLVARRPQAGRHVCRLPAEVCAVSALRPLPRGGLSHRHRGDRRGVPVPGPRPDGVDRRPLATGWRRGGPEAAGATSERRLRCLLGVPRGVRVRAEPRPALR